MADDRSDGRSIGRLPWTNRTRQVEGRRKEAEILKQRGAVPHSNSGAGSIKHDGHDDVYLYEIKDALKSFTLNTKDLRELFVRAVRQDRVPMLLVNFRNAGLVAEIRLVPAGQARGKHGF